jgi:YVTN family beta-propeller protein
VVTLRVSAAVVFCSAFVLVGAVSTAGAPPRVQARIATPGQPIGVAYADGSAWVTSFDRNAVLRVDRATNKVSAVVPVGQGPIGVVAGAGSVWVADWSGGAVTRIDPATNRALATIHVGPSEGPEGMAFGAGAVWISHKEGAVTRIDPASKLDRGADPGRP